MSTIWDGNAREVAEMGPAVRSYGSAKRQVDAWTAYDVAFALEAINAGRWRRPGDDEAEVRRRLAEARRAVLALNTAITRATR